jgi:hypothetical protein
VGRARCVELFDKPDAVSDNERGRLEQSSFRDVREGQVRYEAVVPGHAAEVDDGPGVVHSPEAVHDAFRCSGAARRVHDRRELVRVAIGRSPDRRLTSDNVLPIRAGAGRQWVGNAGYIVGDSARHFPEVIELADENEFRVTVLEDRLDAFRGERRIHRHRDVTGHPDCEVGEEPPGAILRQDRDA